MTDTSSIPPFAPADRSERLDTAAPAEEPARRSIIETFCHAADQAHRVLEAGRQPGMPLSVISNVAREAPLASLLCAFLLGVAVARRR